MKTILLFSPVTNSDHLICLDQVVYVHEITDIQSKYYNYLEIRFSDGSTQIFRANYIDVIEAFTFHSWIESVWNSIIWWFKSKKKRGNK